MGSTASGFVYPDENYAPDGAAQMQALAVSAEKVVAPIGKLASNAAAGQIGRAVNAAQIDASAVQAICSVTVHCVAGRSYEIVANLQYTQVTATSTGTIRFDGQGPGGGIPMDLIFFETTQLSHTYYNPGAVTDFQCTVTGAYAFRITAASSAGALRFPAGAARIRVNDCGDSS